MTKDKAWLLNLVNFKLEILTHLYLVMYIKMDISWVVKKYLFSTCW